MIIEGLTGQMDGQIVATITGTGRRQTRAYALMLAAIGEFDERNLFQTMHAHSTKDWLVTHLRLASSTAYEYLRLARFIRRYPEIADAFYLGEINYSIVRILSGVVDKDTSEEDLQHILDLARVMQPDDLRIELGLFRKKHVPNEEQRLTVTRRIEGGGDVRIHLNELTLQAFFAALKIGELSFQPTNAISTPEPEERPQFDPLANSAQRWRDFKRDRSRFGAPPPRHRFNAFLGMLNLVRTHKDPALRAPGTEVTVVITPNNQPMMHSENIARPDEVTAGIFNSTLRGLLVDKTGEATHLTSPQRFATDRQVHALLAQHHGRCAAPGCTNTRWIEIHHIVDWHRGGKTAMFNLVPLCSGCHSLVTEGRLVIERDKKDAAAIVFRYGKEEFRSHRRMMPLSSQAIFEHKPGNLVSPEDAPRH